MNEWKSEFLNPSLPSIHEKENMPTEAEENMGLKSIKNDLCDPVWNSLLKLSKSKYIIKVSEIDGAIYLSKFLKELKLMIEDPSTNWMEKDERKEQRDWKASLIYAMLETIHTILKNDKIRNLHLNSEALDSLISAFLWVMKYQSQAQPYQKIYEILLNILCDTINVKSGKYFIPCGYASEMEKVKKLAISHGILGLLYYIFEQENTDYATKRIINTKILAYVSFEDIQDQIQVLQSLLHITELPSEEITTQKPPKVKNNPSIDLNLEIMGNGYKSNSPQNWKDSIQKGVLNSQIIKYLKGEDIVDILQKELNQLKVKNQKSRTDEEVKKKQDKHRKRNRDKKLKAKR